MRLLDAGAPPELTRAPLTNTVLYLEATGWLALTGWFSAEVTFYDGEMGWNELVVWDAFDGAMHLWPDVFGSRDELIEAGVDFIVPNQWNHAPITSAQTNANMWDLGSASWLNIEVYDTPIVSPRAEDGETAEGSTAVFVPLWTGVGESRAQKTANAEATQYEFSSADGWRIVRVVELPDRTIVIESFLSSGLGQSYVDVPRLAVDAVRVFSAVG
jgi:hypothetical protein